ncbi:hypothetical protein [Priestia megaterium]|uniref:hypothetical protein n=1 Tax=Priestia megaterium TaxID=1404 RepID=UPI002877E77E|nr:hypothetical protein [Priestia megaterium]
MDAKYALLVLKGEKSKLENKANMISFLPRETTRLQHQLASLDYAIEILEETMMDYE